MRDLLTHLSRTAQPNLVGVEKSGPFVEHAHQIRDRMQPGQALILNDAYIYRNILASGSADDSGRSYGASTYYGPQGHFQDEDQCGSRPHHPDRRRNCQPAAWQFIRFREGPANN
jgi:hypothetical protein